MCHFLNATLGYGDGSIGESIPALLLIDGWDISRLLLLVGFVIFISVIVTAIETAVGQDINSGLTAGRYAFGVIADLIS